MAQIHISQAQAIVEALDLIINQQLYTHQVLPKVLKSNKKWGAKDRRLIASTIYEITRYFHLFDYITQDDSAKQKCWNILASYCATKDIKHPEWKEISIAKEQIKSLYQQANQTFYLRESIPKWLDQLGRSSLATEELWEKEITAQNQEAEAHMRVQPIALPLNHKKDMRLFVQNQLLQEDIRTHILENTPLGLHLDTRKKITHTVAYKLGYIEMQDYSSQLVAPFTQAKPGMKVIDTCAGAGGKSLHLANLMQNNGIIYATDIIDNKLKELTARAKRGKATCIQASLLTQEFIEEHKHSADIVLIDAPCSGLGTLRRKPDIKNKITLSFIEEMIELQQLLLQQNKDLVKPNGALVYATCSILPQENQQQIATFLKINKDFILEEESQLYTSLNGSDGFYMARLRRSL